MCDLKLWSQIVEINRNAYNASHFMSHITDRSTLSYTFELVKLFLLVEGLNYSISTFQLSQSKFHDADSHGQL